jgi:hypothetical protein
MDGNDTRLPSPFKIGTATLPVRLTSSGELVKYE